MVRSLKIIGACVAFIASSASALSHSIPSAKSVAPSFSTETFASSSIKRDAFVMRPAVQKAPIKTGGPAVLDRPVSERKQAKDPVKKKKSIGLREIPLLLS